MSCGSGGCARLGCAAGGCGLPGPSTGGDGGGASDSREGACRDVVGVKLGNNAKTFYVDSTGFALVKGDECVVDSEEGETFATVIQPTGASRSFAAVEGMRKVLRRASPRDHDLNRQRKQLRKDAFGYCRQKAVDLHLEMKVLDVDPSLDGRKLICFFTASERVDFREMVRDLAQKFRRRIEMRQIGARDEARMMGGYGICGRILCCTTFLTEFSPISVKMAKRQGLSLNPSKIAGLCGRLMCCLRYEDHDAPKTQPASRDQGSKSGPARARSRRSQRPPGSSSPKRAR